MLVFCELNREPCLVECLVISTLLFGVEWFKLQTLCATCPLPCQKCSVILVENFEAKYVFFSREVTSKTLF